MAGRCKFNYSINTYHAQVFARGIICNYLVCLAVWLATAANDLGGKFIGVLLPISAFVTMSMVGPL